MLIFATYKVLIDTWWNVNIVKRLFSRVSITVLIDTWWNVNFILADLNFDALIVLIDTWWNVNSNNNGGVHVDTMF